MVQYIIDHDLIIGIIIRPIIYTGMHRSIYPGGYSLVAVRATVR